MRGVPIPSACDKTWVPAPMLKDIQTWLTGKSRGKKSFEGTKMEKGPISTLIPPCIIEKTVPTSSNHPVHHASKQMLSLVEGPYCTAAAQSRSCEFSLSSVRRSPANYVSHSTQSPKDLCKCGTIAGLFFATLCIGPSIFAGTMVTFTHFKHVRCNPDVAPRLTSGGYEDKVDVITPFNILLTGGGEIWKFDPL